MERRIRAAAPLPAATDDVLDRVVTRKRRRAVVRKVGTIATVMVVIGGTFAAFAAVGAGPARQPAGEPTATPTATGELGLSYPVCDISTMPIGTAMGPGTASVFTRADGGCPKQPGSDAFVGVGVDINGDGVLDATAGPVPDCYFTCEAFAAPDVNGDGASEIMVSTQGADGYGIFLYAITTDPPSIAPVTKDGDPFQFAWAAVAAHSDTAHCATTDTGAHTFVLTDASFNPPDGSVDSPEASVDSTSYSIDGTVATKVGEDHTTVPLRDAPAPTEELCGAPIHGSATRDVSGQTG
jgi:hypothetical protein